MVQDGRHHNSSRQREKIANNTSINSQLRRQPLNLQYIDPEIILEQIRTSLPTSLPQNAQRLRQKPNPQQNTKAQTKQKAQFHNESPLTIPPSCAAPEPAHPPFLFLPSPDGGAVIHKAESNPGLSSGATNGTVCVGDASYGTR